MSSKMTWTTMLTLFLQIRCHEQSQCSNHEIFLSVIKLVIRDHLHRLYEIISLLSKTHSQNAFSAIDVLSHTSESMTSLLCSSIYEHSTASMFSIVKKLNVLFTINTYSLRRVETLKKSTKERSNKLSSTWSTDWIKIILCIYIFAESFSSTWLFLRCETSISERF